MADDQAIVHMEAGKNPVDVWVSWHTCCGAVLHHQAGQPDQFGC